jgi:hypothetical protein
MNVIGIFWQICILTFSPIGKMGHGPSLSSRWKARSPKYK